MTAALYMNTCMLRGFLYINTGTCMLLRCQCCTTSRAAQLYFNTSLVIPLSTCDYNCCRSPDARAAAACLANLSVTPCRPALATTTPRAATSSYRRALPTSPTDEVFVRLLLRNHQSPRRLVCVAHHRTHQELRNHSLST